MSERIEILCSANRAYGPLLAVMLKSLLAAKHPETRLRVHAIHHDLPVSLRAVIDSYFSLHTAEILWINESRGSLGERIDVPEGFFDLPGNGHYDRLLTPFLVEGARAIYLDCDLWIQGDLTDLWRYPLEDGILAAVTDQNIPTLASEPGFIDWETRNLLPNAPYFNSGVLLLPLDRWRENAFSKKVIAIALDFVDRFGGAPPLQDQYALNVAAYGSWQALPVEWNRFSAFVREDPSTDQIIHFAGGHKPFLNTRFAPASTKFFIRRAENATREAVTTGVK